MAKSSPVTPNPAPPYIDPDLLALASNDERKAYLQAVRKHQALKSPLDLAVLLFPETRRWAHIELLNDHLVALAEYRLTAHGPGIPGTTELTFHPADGTLQSATVLLRTKDASLFTATGTGTSGTGTEGAGTGRCFDEDGQPTGWYIVRVPVVFRLSVSMRPRSGKSRIVNEVYPLWLMLLAEEAGEQVSVAVGTYSDDFASDWGGKMRDLANDHHEDPDSPCASFLPRPIKGRNSAKAVFRTTTGSSTTFAGVGGSITGKGYQVLIGDDFIKNDTEAQSPQHRKAARGFYDSTWTTRKTISFAEDSRFPIPLEVLMGTRWHHEDVIGYACYYTDDDGTRVPSPEWCILNIPAVCEDPETDPLNREEGEVHPNASGEGKEFHEAKKIDNPMVFASLYQGRPSPKTGGLIPANLKPFSIHQGRGVVTFTFEKPKTLPANPETGIKEGMRQGTATETITVSTEDLIFFGTVDVAATKKTTSDYTVAFTCAYSREHQALFLLNRFRKRITTDEYLEHLVPFFLADSVTRVLVENVSYGLMFAQQLRKDHRFKADTYPASGDKVSRALTSGLPSLFRAGRIYAPNTASWREHTEAECRDFPNADHDDVVDALGAAAEFVSTVPKYRPAKEQKPPSLQEEIDAHVDKQASRRRRNDPWSRISRR